MLNWIIVYSVAFEKTIILSQHILNNTELVNVSALSLFQGNQRFSNYGLPQPEPEPEPEPFIRKRTLYPTLGKSINR